MLYNNNIRNNNNNKKKNKNKKKTNKKKKKKKKIGKNRCLMSLNNLFLFCGVVLSLKLFCLMNQGSIKGEVGRPQTS